MIANLIATIMMALGVATGNVSSNVYKGGNAFYDAEHTKPTQRALEERNLLNINYYELAQSIGDNNNKVCKYYLKDTNQSNNNTPNYKNEYMNVYNSIYTKVRNQSNITDIGIITIMKIDNYYKSTNNTITYNEVQYLRTENASNIQINYATRFRIYDNNTLDNLINVTLANSQSYTDIENAILNDSSYINQEVLTGTLSYIDSGTTSSNYWYEYKLDQAHIINEIENHSNYTLMLLDYFYTYNANIQYVTPMYATNNPSLTNRTLINIRGYIDNTPINYEIIDVPNVMYTILTMPFSFISTAFNLTVFPGTPYALNFGNLFLTIVAIFILLWIIKKVFH